MEDKKQFDLTKVGRAFSEKTRSGIEAARDSAKKAKESVSASAGTIIRSIDQTGDGKLNLDDIVEVKNRIQEKERQAKLLRDRNALCPVFREDVSEGSFAFPKMIRIAEKDKKHAASRICDGAIGHESSAKDLRILTIYPEQISCWDLQFYPNNHQTLYYVSPVDPRFYISVDCYFDYLLQARIGELQRIAQDLGASYFRVKISERKKSLYQKSASEKLSGKMGRAKGEHSSKSNELSDGEVAAQSSFEGHAPACPELLYFRNEPQILSLIEMRLCKTGNTLTEQHLSLSCMHSSGIKENTAASIETAFSSMKLGGASNFVQEAQNEVRQIFEYDIVF